MTARQILDWCLANPELALVAAGSILSVPGAIYALVKTAYQRVTGRAAKGGAWVVLDVVTEVLPNIPGALNRVVRARGGESIFAPPAPRATQAPPQGGA